ncbi:MAG: hypothetical protein NZ522_06835, partial [Chitinophagales bacterium]|nr:hypothetical protein [Chitinophagales bacterium]
MNLLFEENSLFHTSETDSFPKVKKFSLEVNGISVPVRIFFENTYTERASIVKSGVIIRISRYATSEEKRRQIQTFLSWAKNKIIQRPEILHYLPQRRYMDGEVLKVGKYIFNIRLTYNKQRKSFARIVQ